MQAHRCSWIHPGSSVASHNPTRRKWFLPLIALGLMASPLAHSGPTPAAPTTTTLQVLVGAVPVTTVANPSAVTLKATVVDSSSHPVKFGTVIFCDHVTAPCTDLNQVGAAEMVQLGVDAGTASVTIIPGIGSHSYTAYYHGVAASASFSQTKYAPSVSAAVPFAVTGLYPTTTSISKSGVQGNYTLKGTVAGVTNALTTLTGQVSFLDTTNANFNLGSVNLGTAAFSLPFANGGSQSIPTAVNDFAVADLNNDGIPDLVIAGGGVGPAVYVYEGLPNGTYLQQAVFSGVSASHVTVADVNGDGLPDIVLTGSSSITSYLQTGNWNFTAVSSTGPFITRNFVLADVDGDGALDLVADNATAGSIDLFKGNNAGGFAANGSMSILNGADAVAVGDFNKDGIPDIAYVSYGVNLLGVLLGNGDFTFKTAVTYPTQSQPISLTTADFDGDGNLDLAVVNAGSNSVSVYLGNAKGKFTLKSTPATDPIGHIIVAGDFNGDGVPDLAVATISDEIDILLGKGNGTFKAPLSLNLTGMHVGLAAADLNGDGVSDLVDLVNNGAQVNFLLAQPTWTASATLKNVSPVGASNHDVLASYGGDSNFNTSQSSTVALKALALETTLTLVPNPTSSRWGDQVALVATLSPFASQGHTTDGQFIKFFDGNTLLNVIPLSGGQATLNISNLSIGQHTLYASYLGDTNFTASNANAVSFTVSKALSTTTLVAADTTPTVGKPDVLTATVVGFTAPRGNVIFKQDGNTLCTVPLSAAGTAKCTFTASDVMPVHFVATYQGDDFHDPSSSSPLTLSPVWGIDPNLTLTFDSMHLLYPGATNLKVCVARATSATPTGTVLIFDGATLIKTLTLGGDACAYWYIDPALNAGTHKIRALYLGDAHNYGGYTPITDIVVDKVTPYLGISCWDSNFAYGKDYHCGINMSSTAGAPPGNITYKVDGGGKQTLTLSNGIASFVLNKPKAGNHTVEITYTGSTNFNAVGPYTENFTVTLAPVDMQLVPSTWYGPASTGVTFTVSITSWSAGPPSNLGKVKFYDGNTLLKTVDVDSNGQASFFTKSLSPGQHTITADFAGAPNYSTASRSVTITLTGQTP